MAWTSYGPRPGLELSDAPGLHPVIYDARISGVGATGAAALMVRADNLPCARQIQVSQFGRTFSQAHAPGPVLELPHRVIDLFAANGGTASGELRLWNVGSAPLNYAVSDDASWLDLAAANGTISDQNATALVGLTTRPMSNGVHSAHITISDGRRFRRPWSG